MIHLFCALRCEAIPIIDHFKLSRYPEKHIFDVFVNKNNSVSLTISGVGKVSAASALIYTHMLMDTDKQNGWINFGIAGHPSLDVGTPLIANKIVDGANGNTWYPQILYESTLCSETVISIIQPDSEYPERAAFDMEASGFYESAAKISTTEFCHSLKIISDNRNNHFKNINKKNTSQLIYKNLDSIRIVVDGLTRLTEEISYPVMDDEFLNTIFSKWHFTHSQRSQLLKSITRWNVLMPDRQILIEDINGLSNSRQILEHINDKLNRARIHY